MKRAGNLMERILSLDNLMLAYTKAFRGKQDREEVIQYSENIWQKLDELRTGLSEGTFEIGRYHYFWITDPKLRKICAASFDERVMHHAVMNVCHDIFERQLIETTYATRKEKGQYKALKRANAAMRHFRFVAKCDFRKYFDTVCHQTLKRNLARVIKDADVLLLMYRIIDSYETDEGRGLPIGNLTSQYFANFYLSGMDHYVKEVLKVKEYVRYMDDFLVFGMNKREVRRTVEAIEEYARENLELTLKPVVYNNVLQGTSFLGYRLYPHKILLNGRSKKRFVRKYVMYDKLLKENVWSETDYQRHLLPLMAFAEKCNTKGLEKSCVNIL